MLDKKIEYIGVMMDKKDVKNYPHHDLPIGYTFCNYTDGLEHAWSKLQYDLEQTESLEEAEGVFERDFLSDLQGLKQKCVFVKDAESNIVGTASAWYGTHLGTTLHRVHWVAVAESHQNKGIAKALMTRVMDIYNEMDVDYVYLTTQTWSYKAIKMYLAFGFEPYLGEKPINWKFDSYEVDNPRAWNLIFSLLNQTGDGKHE